MEHKELMAGDREGSEHLPSSEVQALISRVYDLYPKGKILKRLGDKGMIFLSPDETAILLSLAQRPDQYVTPQEMQEVYQVLFKGKNRFNVDNVDVYISNLRRKKINDPSIKGEYQVIESKRDKAELSFRLKESCIINVNYDRFFPEEEFAVPK